jgi:hypothetical protein
MPESAAACNCTLRRRYGVLWTYDFEGKGIKVSGATQACTRAKSNGFHFCPEYGCVWHIGDRCNLRAVLIRRPTSLVKS